MTGQRIEGHVSRGEAVTIRVDGEALTAFEGESLAAALIAGGDWRFRCDKSGRFRAPYCNMGVCFECLLWVLDGQDWRRVRACMTPVAAGLQVKRSLEVRRTGP